MAFSSTDKYSLGMGAGGIFSGLAGLLGKYNNPADKANQSINQIPGQTAPYYAPWMNAGMQSLNGLQDQYGQLTNDPGGKFNQIGNSFHESPGFKFALQQALQSAGHAAAAGGMAGSPQHEQQNMGLATDLANQDYYNYMSGATGLYGQGLQGMQGLSQQGQQAGSSMADQIAQSLSQKGQYDYEGQAGKNAAKSQAWGNLGAGLMSAFLPFL